MYMGAMADNSVRLDRWLWAARFFKTRRLATDAIKGGKVSVDGVRAKPARAVKGGERVVIAKGLQTFSVDVVDLAEQRGPASVAQNLYAETPESQQARAQKRTELAVAKAAQPRPAHRPERRNRRELAAFKRGGGD